MIDTIRLEQHLFPFQCVFNAYQACLIIQALIVLNWFESTERIHETILSSKTMDFNENISVSGNLQS